MARFRRTLWRLSGRLSLNSAVAGFQQMVRGRRENRRIQVSWSKPRDGWFRLNTDGSMNQNNNISCGGVIRDANGIWFSGFLANLGKGNSFEAEMWGLLYGLQLAIELNIHFLEIESNNLELVNCIRGSSSLIGSSRNIKHDIQTLMRRFESVEIHHVYREQNKVADRLAVEAHSIQPGFSKLELRPSYIYDLLRDDVVGISFPRMIPG